jgi:hypothetical protein
MTVPIGVSPELLGLSSAMETAGAGTMAGATGATAPEMTCILPPGNDAASIAAADALMVRGGAAVGMMSDLTTVRGLFAATIGANGAGYAAVDAINQATLAL